ncbi:MAG: alpha-L-arabinofuranosidase C-terminal domain-containing protein [Fimbriimonadaceae bacterium]|nr:alpha-L-arabinofuranosidase C-terminal domain-containing protein [Fimbriimonadaceae bacterium]
MLTATIHLDPKRHRGPIDRRIFGTFLEHMGRAVYEGAYDPASPRSDEHGFRTDVLTALSEMGASIVRYPGGNFVSTYNWKNGIGPKDKRPRRPDYAWKSVETNQFGTDDFIAWCRKGGFEPMMTVNLGTRGAEDACEWLEYCNLPRGYQYSDLRPQEEPYAVQMWCLGNEMDGPWQAGHVPAHEYAMRAQQAAKIMKGLDERVQTVAAGSSGRFMSTYLDWDREVLEFGWDDFDFIAAHRYSQNNAQNTAEFLAEGVEIERVITDYRSLVGYIRGRRRSNRHVYLSFDEWNVWYKNMETDGKWSEAPHLIEEVYNVEDALVVAQYLNAFIRNADFVRAACLAQAVNIIGPLLTQRDGLLKQSIYYAFQMIAQSVGSHALEALIESPQYPAGRHGEVPVLDGSASFDPKTGETTLVLVNRSQTEGMSVQVPGYVAASATRLHHSDPKLDNTWDEPTRVVPHDASAEALIVPPLSITTVRLLPESDA